MDSTEKLLGKTLAEKLTMESQVSDLKSSSSSSVTDKSSLDEEVFRKNLVNMLTSAKNMFYVPSFKIYNSGVSGLYDYAPPGCALKSNVLALWRQHFVLEENMLEVDCPCITPEVVLQASGHVDKFTDLMVKDEKAGTFHRADHLLKDFCTEKLQKELTALSAEKVQELKHVLAMVADFSPEQLGSKIKEYGVVAPVTKNPVSDPYPFNLMFQTSIGPSGAVLGYMRPETAQGIFVNFKDSYYYNGSKLPFAAAQIGQAFRNEISPRQGLFRVREFTLAEIEHFVDPEDKYHPRLSEVEDLEFLMFPREEQGPGKDAVKLRLGDAVTNGTVNNQTLAYFIGRNVCGSVSILEMRWHIMQHAEIQCSYGWTECVGIADRSAYDLRAHSEKSGIPLVAHEKFSAPREVEKLVIIPVKEELGLAFKGNQKKIVEALEAMDEKEAMEVKAALELHGEVEFQVCTLGKAVTIKPSMVSISKEIKKEYQRVFTPSVIEPSFGIGRIIYCLFEHSFYTRPEDEKLNVFRFPPVVAPIKCTVFPLVQDKKDNKYDAVAKEISKSLTAAGVSNKLDTTGTTIGKRYARTDELGVPFAITVDDDTTTVTIRERDSRDQIRVEINKVVRLVQDLTNGVRTWANIQSEYPCVPFKKMNDLP
ncbi:hypothetical protein C5167_012673 [Papaver somniferum]|uniref:Glycine--tRNA ligase n=1 Tax=Papaver somniferum TaxID=3469 RepID=A0A4Y7J217_PAPSO|nr:hypothetical protein C5167_012673 [Papaver somniferum]